jgi:hypothetical protein
MLFKAGSGRRLAPRTAPKAPRPVSATRSRDGYASIFDSDFYKTDEWRKLKEQRKTMDGGKCAHCGSKVDLHVHHIRSRSKGQKESLSNLITLCEDCHTKEHRHMERRK